MKKLLTSRVFYYSLQIAFFSLPAHAQVNITGRVVDENGDQPLRKASVYFNFTTISTYTDAQGNFSFEAIRLLNTDMIISCPGYELLVYKPDAEKLEKKRVVFKLRAAVSPSKNKLTLAETVRRKCLDIFYQELLGVSKEASKCVVQNEATIYFLQGANNSSFIALADTPLVITNDQLGYKLSYNLVGFSYDDITGYSELEGYTRFEPFENDKKFAKARRDCYEGSRMHFFRSLFTGKLYEEGFSTFWMHPVLDTLLREPQKGELVVPGFGLMRIEPISAQQLLFIDSANNLSIHKKGLVLTQYFKNPAGKEFLVRNGFTEGSLSKGIEAYMLFKSDAIGINIAGVLSDPDGVQYTGYWMYEKTANSLPYDYKLE